MRDDSLIHSNGRGLVRRDGSELIYSILSLGAGAPVWALTLAAFFLYRPIVLPHNELAWKTLAMLPFLIALAATFLARARAPRTQGESAWTT